MVGVGRERRSNTHRSEPDGHRLLVMRSLVITTWVVRADWAMAWASVRWLTGYRSAFPRPQFWGSSAGRFREVDCFGLRGMNNWLA